MILTFSKTKNSPLIIFSHGFKGFKDWGAFNFISNTFANSGLNFLKFNFSHNGISQENLLEFSDLESFGQNNLSIELEDLDSVINWSIKNLNERIDNKQIYLLGHSRGGGISILTAVNSKIQKLILWGSLSDFEKESLMKRLICGKKRGVVYIFNSRTNQQMPLYYQFYQDYIKNKNKFSISNACGNLNIPCLIVHGDKDKTVEYSEAKALNKNISNSILLKIKEKIIHLISNIRLIKDLSNNLK